MALSINTARKIIKKLADIKDPTTDKVSRVLIRNNVSKSQMQEAIRAFGQKLFLDVKGEKLSLIKQFLVVRSIRSLSGVSTVSVMTKPYPCPGKCIFCPSDRFMPKSYISNEPGAQRGLANDFDPYKQVRSRLKAYVLNGHPVDKIELIILGGCFNFYPRKYQIWFIKRCFDALNQKTHDTSASWGKLFAAQTKNEKAKSRCVGLVVETRPDLINKKELVVLRKLGVTKVQIGVQSLSNRVLHLNKRGHTVDDSKKAIGLLRLFGFKIQIHWMPNLYGSSALSDIKEYKKIFESKDFKPDEIKIYPCSLVYNTELESYYKAKKWKPYTEKALKKVLTFCLKSTPRFCRVSRMVRDISSNDIVVGNKKSNLRQEIENELKEKKVKIEEIRCREIRGKHIFLKDLQFVQTEYDTSVSREIFLEYVDKKDDSICGFLRLSFPKAIPPIVELKNSCLIREVHIYGKSLELAKSESGTTQHIGIGKKLIQKAKQIAKKRGFSNLAVISSIGTRQYYKKLGFIQKPLYQHFSL